MTVAADESTEDASVRAVRTVREVARAIKSRWWILVLGILIGMVAALGFSMLETPMYQATSTLYVTSAPDVNSQNAYQSSLASEQRVASYAELVTSKSVLDKALSVSGLDISRSAAAASLSVSASKDTVLLHITSVLDDPSKAAQLVNAVSVALSDYVSVLERPVGGGSPAAKVSVVSPATAVDDPISPRLDRNLLLGSGCGFLFGIIAIYLVSRVDTRVRSERDVRAVVGEAVLGSIPELPGSDLTGPASDQAISKGGTVWAESYRRLRANLAFVGVDSPARVIMVTSPSPGDGKSTVAVNLASVIADSGQSVVLVDADLRRPTIAARLGLNGAIGLTSALSEEFDLSEFVQTGDVSNLNVVASGPLPPDPAELLGSLRARDYIRRLSEVYDYVIVDSPPILSVVDPAVLSQWVDGVVLVVREGETSRPAVVRAVDQLSTARARLLGVVLNSASDGVVGYGAYGYSYLSSPSGEETGRDSIH